MTIHINQLCFSSQQNLTTIADTLGIQYEDISPREFRLDIPADKPLSGQINSLQFDASLNVLLLDIEPEVELQLHYQPGSTPYLRMLFCIEGKSECQMGSSGFSFQLSPLMNASMARSHTHSHSISLPPEQRQQFLLLNMEQEAFVAHYPDSQDMLLESMRGHQDEDHYLHIGYYNLAIASAIRELNQHDYQGVVRLLFVHAKCLEIMALMIHQIYQEQQSGSKVLLNERDLEIVVKARQLQLESLRNPPTISQLARMVGTNENTLKQNFKKVYNMTINQSLTEARLNHARMLLAARELSVNKISVEVGYRNPSHFARIFRHRFGMLPSEFLQRLSD
jgi:AraC-like DNA-binding protein